MYPFSETVMPALRSHQDAQMAFCNDLSKSMFRSFEQWCGLNIHVVQTLLEEASIMSYQMATAERPIDVIDAVSSRAKPTSDKLRAYQQHSSRLAADVQVEMSNVVEKHGAITNRAARTLAEEVAWTAGDEIERGMRTQQGAVHDFNDSLKQPAAAAKGESFGVSMKSTSGSDSDRDRDRQEMTAI